MRARSGKHLETGVFDPSGLLRTSGDPSPQIKGEFLSLLARLRQTGSVLQENRFRTRTLNTCAVAYRRAQLRRSV